DVIKLADLGLARVDTTLDGASMTTLTQEGSVLGTPEFLAPEQARNPMGADIRADIYSLGCTFYFLLTAEVPFPGGTLAEKLMHHQMDERLPIEKVAPKVRTGVGDICRRMMAKAPAARYQPPRELAQDLAKPLKRKRWLSWKTPVPQRSTKMAPRSS